MTVEVGDSDEEQTDSATPTDTTTPPETATPRPSQVETETTDTTETTTTTATETTTAVPTETTTATTTSTPTETTTATTTTATKTTTTTTATTATTTTTSAESEALVARYRFEESLADSAGEYDLSGTGVEYTDGPEGSTASAWPGFASTDFVSLENDEALTFCYWMRDDGTESTWDDDLVWKITSENGDGVGSFCTTDGDVFLWTSGDNTLNQSTTSVLDGQWHHVAFVYEQSSNRMQLFIDGNREYDVEYTDNLSGMDRTALMFGNNGSDGWKEYDGGIDDFRLYRRALTASEVSEIANS